MSRGIGEGVGRSAYATLRRDKYGSGKAALKRTHSKRFARFEGRENNFGAHGIWLSSTWSFANKIRNVEIHILCAAIRQNDGDHIIGLSVGILQCLHLHLGPSIVFVDP